MEDAVGERVFTVRRTDPVTVPSPAELQEAAATLNSCGNVTILARAGIVGVHEGVLARADALGAPIAGKWVEDVDVLPEPWHPSLMRSITSRGTAVFEGGTLVLAFSEGRSSTMEESYVYDVAVTFAGEDREFVEAVVRDVASAGYKVFYDQDEQVTLWGEELTEFFPRIYEERSRYAVMFVSRHYAAKPWTRLERRSVLVRAMNQPTPYLLPVRLDSTRLAGVRETISYLDGTQVGAKGVAMAIRQKLGAAQGADGGAFNGLVPRNGQEVMVLVGERPAGWEYLLFAYQLVHGVELLHSHYLDHSIGFAEPAEFIVEEDVIDVVHRELGVGNGIVRNFDAVMSETTQKSVFGPLGNVNEIVHMAERYISVYQAFMQWERRIMGYATRSVEARRLFEALAAYAQQPVERMQNFAYELREMADPIHSQLVNGQKATLVLALTLEVSSDASAEFARAMKRFRKTRRV